MDLCKAGSFSYSEWPQIPRLEGISLHWWNNDVERPWGILSLFTTCLWLWVKSHCHICRTCSKKQSAEHAPKSSWEKRRVLQNAEKKLASSRIFTFCQPYRVTSGRIIHSMLVYTRAKQKVIQTQVKKERKERQPSILDTTQSTANITSISIYISLIYN